MFSQEPAFAGRLNPAEGVNDLYTNGQMHGKVYKSSKFSMCINKFVKDYKI